MRQTKFRVWDRLLKQWLVYKVHNIHPIHLYFTKDGTNNSEFQWCIDSDNFDVVQCTGLKDKNGVEIYEGDIVKMNVFFGGNAYNEDDDSLDRDYTGQIVVLASKGTCLKKPKWVDNVDDYSGQLGWYKPVSGCNSEIIGNIYENPDLL